MLPGDLMSTLRKIVKIKLIDELKYIFPVFRPKKILFDHVPKCGGTSVNYLLRKNYRDRKIYWIDGTDPLRSVAEFKALSKKERWEFDLVAGHLAHDLLDYVHPESLRVTVLRNPVDRIVSHYYYAKSNNEHYLYDVIHSKNLSLDEYVQSEISDELRNWCTMHFSGFSRDSAESDPQGAVEAAYRVLMEKYNLVGIMELYSCFSKQLCEMANLLPIREAVKQNVNVMRPKTDEIEPDVINNVIRLNSLDLKLYDKLREMY